MIVAVALALAAATVAVHAGGLVALLKALARTHAKPPTAFWSMTWLLVRVTWALLLIHAVEIAIWALFFLWAGCLPDAEPAFYFAGVTYATVRYGDLVLPRPWRMFGPIPGLTGILMCGLSTGCFFAVLKRMLGGRIAGEPR